MEIKIIVDREHAIEHLVQLGSDDRNLRFCHQKSDESIRDYVLSIDTDDYVAGIYADNKLAALLHLSIIHLENEKMTELGISVLPEHRGLGLGSHLVRHAIEHTHTIGAL